MVEKLANLRDNPNQMKAIWFIHGHQDDAHPIGELIQYLRLQIVLADFA